MTLGRPLRVAITSNTLRVGGAERQRVLLANGLARLGHEVTLVVLQEVGQLAEFLDPRVGLARSRPTSGRLPARQDVIVTGVTNTEAAFAVVARLRSVGRTRWLAVSHSWPSGSGSLYSWPLRQLVSTATAIGGLTEGHVLALQASEGWTRPLEVLPNGTEVAPGPIQPVCDMTRLGYIGRIEHVKGLDRLLHALERLPEGLGWTLDVFGDGSARAGLEAFATARRLPVTWRGWAANVAEALASVDLLVIPSRSEALPMVALEALSFGVPLIASGVGALPDVLPPDGLLPDDEATWPDRLSSLITDPTRRERLRGEGLRMSDRWRMPAMVDAYERVLTRLAGPP